MSEVPERGSPGDENECLARWFVVLAPIRPFPQKNRESLFPTRDFGQIKQFLASILAGRHATRSLAKNFRGLPPMKISFRPIATVPAVQRGEIAMRVDHLRLKAKRRFKGDNRRARFRPIAPSRHPD